MKYLFIAIALTAGALAGDAPRIASVDMQQVVAKYWKFPLAQQRIKTTQETLQKQLDALQKEARDLARNAKELELDIDSPAVKDVEAKKTELQKLKLTLQQKQQTMGQTERRFQQELYQVRDKEHGAIITEVKNVIATYAVQKKIDFVLDSSATQRHGDTLVFAGPKFDITADILKILNAGTALMNRPQSINSAAKKGSREEAQKTQKK